ILVPITHHFVDPTTVQHAGQAADVIVENPMERNTGRRQFQPSRNASDVAVRSRAARWASDVAVERLHHSEYELAHSLTPPFTILSNSRTGIRQIVQKYSGRFRRAVCCGGFLMAERVEITVL